MNKYQTLFLFPLVVTGCGLNLRLVDATVKKPSNVAVYFNVRDHKGRGVPNLTAQQFAIYEDDKLVSPFESKQTILNPQVAVGNYTLLLMDMSGSVTQSGSSNQLVDAAASFTDRVSKTQEVAVYSFDGAKEIRPVVPFATAPAAVKTGLDTLRSYKPQDPSTNLNGAVVEALAALQQKMERSPQPLHFGTLVVFTDGTDHAQRVTREGLMAALDRVDGKVNVFVIGVGAESDPEELDAIGRQGSVLAKDPGAVKAAFEEIAKEVEADTRSFYLFSYCSPARAGQHQVRIVADTPDGKGDLQYAFDATGFQPNCDPNLRPTIDLAHPRPESAAAAPPPVKAARRPAKRVVLNRDTRPAHDTATRAALDAPARHR